MGENVKENFKLPHLNSKYQSSLHLRNDKFYVRPKLKRIIYTPIPHPTRHEDRINIMKAFISNKNYEEVHDEAIDDKIAIGLKDSARYLGEREERTSKVLIGKQAPIRYYENYKELNKILSKRKVEKNIYDDDPVTAVLQATQSLKVLPKCLGLVKTRGQPTILNLNGQKLGDNYIKAISAGLKNSKLIQTCQFSNNRLTDAGFSAIVKGIGHEIIKVDVSFNQITKIDQKLMNIILEPQARLQVLNLEGNLITDKATEALCINASYSKNLKYINLRKNLLTAKSADSISDLLHRSSVIEELYIGTNRIYDEGAVKIFDSLVNNKTIRVFDFCFNKLGQSKPSCVKAITNFLTKNKTVTHVDLSSNSFSVEESKQIGESLESNKTIYGFHFAGNHGFIDSRGFYIYDQKDITTLHSLIDVRINSYDLAFRREPIGFEPTSYRNVCWICEGWYEETFRFVVHEEDPDGKKLVYIHFDFEEYRPRLINVNDKNVKYKAMVPPRTYKYFYTNARKQVLDPSPEIATMDCEFTFQYTYEMYHEKITFKVEKVNLRKGKPKKIVNAWNQLVVEVLPRQIGLVTKKQKKPWTFTDSLWSKEWKIQDQQLTRNCFEKDWKNSKLTNLLKNQTEQEKAKELLFTNYKLIKQIYKHYASWSPFNGDIWAIANNAFTEFCHQAKIISKEAPLKIIDLTFITTNSMSGADWKGNSLVPERGLVRFQFMEALVRLSQEKFKKNGLSDSILNSTRMMIDSHINPLANNTSFQSQKWRKEKYWKEQNDMLIKKYRQIFTDLYKKNSKLKVKPGNKPFMCLSQFKSIIERIGLAGTLVQERDIFISFNCSMMTQVDQIENQRLMRMSEIEFIEAVARCAAILPQHCKVESVFEGECPLHAKFEWMIHELKMLCSQDLKSQFPSNQSLFRKNDEDN